MATYKDSLGNSYASLPTKPPVHTAKSTRHKTSKKRLKSREVKYARYRARVGRPNGPGQPGNKSGKNKIKA